MKRSLLVMLLFVSAGRAQAQDFAAGNPHFDEFYTVKEQSTKSFDNDLMNPLQAAQNMWDDAEGVMEIQVRALSLLSFDHHNEQYGNVGEAYNRNKHFGGWIHDRRDSDCFNTRGKVLVRDSSVPVSVSSSCTVKSGRWEDPYSGREYTQANDLQIDHFVPLKNAYVSGAHKWNRLRRCLYANYLGNDFHLLAVYGRENTSKSDKTPEGYMPPNSAYQCQYLAQWLKVKLIWGLGLTPPEKDTVVELVQDNHCDLNQFNYSAQDLSAQRRFIADNMDLCQ